MHIFQKQHHFNCIRLYLRQRLILKWMVLVGIRCDGAALLAIGSFKLLLVPAFYADTPLTIMHSVLH